MPNLKSLKSVTQALILVSLFSPNIALGEDLAQDPVKEPAAVAPPQDKAKKKPETAPKTDAVEEAKTAEPMPEVPPRSAISEALSDHFSLGTSIGFVSVKKKGDDWRANGAADITATYVTSMHLGSSAITFTGRYLPMEVSPMAENEGEKQEYSGTLQVFAVGVGMRIPIGTKGEFQPTAELAFMKPKLEPLLTSTNVSTPDQSGTGVILGALVHWKLREGFYLGPQLHVSGGTFTTTQLSANASFVF